jgi:hypothetical protein
MAIKRSKKSKRRQLSRTVAISISHSELSMVIVDKQPGGVCSVRGYRSHWLQQATGLTQEQGVAELTAALAPIVESENLAGGSVNITLSSDFCVTRVVAGEIDKMIPELRGLRDRSAHYLSLGAGPKAVSQALHELDLKNSQASLTVTNQNTLDNLIHAVEDAGLHPELIEHSMVAVCRAVGRMGGDHSAPAIIIEPNDRGVDLGISYRGQLLFDYRPGGVGSKETIVEIVEHHLERIQRYCSRFFRFATGQLNRVYLVGNTEDVEQVRYQFRSSKRLTAEVLNPTTICADWSFAESLVENPFYVAPLGSALVEGDQLRLPPDQRGFPDLMDVIRSGIREPLWPAMRQHLWPVAAAGFLGAVVYTGALLKHAQAGSVEGRITTIQSESGSASTMKLEIESLGTRSKYLKLLDDELNALPVHELLAEIVKVKPAAVYLDDIKVSHDGIIILVGKAASRDAMLEFEASVKKIPLLRSPLVDSAQPTKLPNSENAVVFRIKGRFTGSTGHDERSDRND